LDIREAGRTARFELCRESAVRGFNAGLSPEAMIGTLERLSGRGVPQNVGWSLNDWHERYSAAAVYRGVVLAVALGLGLAALLSGVNPKNLMLTFSAAVSVAQAGLATASVILAFVIYILIASATVAAPVLVYLITGDRAEKTLNAWKAWLTENNGTVMCVLFLVFGMVLLGKGISGL
jgi:hypothetical protein